MPIMENYPVKNPLPDTINLHFTPHCNARCKFCFAEYSDVKSPCSIDEWMQIISCIAEVPFGGQARRVNFVGGEPTVHKNLPELLAHAKSVGLRTSMVTNGFALLMHGIEPYADWIDLIGLSIDSIDPRVIAKTGRYHRGTGYIPTERHWLALADKIHRRGIDLKINTVVNRLNRLEDIGPFIVRMNPHQWKLFQVTRVEGQNDIHFDDWEVSPDEFDKYCQRHRLLAAKGLHLVKESCDLMLNSYAIIGPNGCFVDNTNEGHRYSRPILDAGIASAWNEVYFDYEAFRIRRGNQVISEKEAAYA